MKLKFLGCRYIFRRHSFLIIMCHKEGYFRQVESILFILYYLPHILQKQKQLKVEPLLENKNIYLILRSKLAQLLW